MQVAAGRAVRTRQRDRVAADGVRQRIGALRVRVVGLAVRVQVQRPHVQRLMHVAQRMHDQRQRVALGEIHRRGLLAGAQHQDRGAQRGHDVVIAGADGARHVLAALDRDIGVVVLLVAGLLARLRLALLEVALHVVAHAGFLLGVVLEDGALGEAARHRVLEAIAGIDALDAVIPHGDVAQRDVAEDALDLDLGAMALDQLGGDLADGVVADGAEAEGLTAASGQQRQRGDAARKRFGHDR